MVASAGFRVEVIRFGLLVTLTLALLTVAIRISSHPSAHHAVHVPPVTVSSPPSSVLTTPTPTVPTPTPTPRHTTGGGSGNGGNGNGGSGGSGPTSTKPVLPVTGWDAAARLTAAALALISAGGLSIAGTRRVASPPRSAR